MAASEDKKQRATQGPRGRVYINRERCKGCGYCVEFCPTHVLDLDEGFNEKGYHPPVAVSPQACTGCGLCGLYCPDFAIHGERLVTDNKPSEVKNDVTA